MNAVSRDCRSHVIRSRVGGDVPPTSKLASSARNASGVTCSTERLAPVNRRAGTWVSNTESCYHRGSDGRTVSEGQPQAIPTGEVRNSCPGLAGHHAVRDVLRDESVDAVAVGPGDVSEPVVEASPPFLVEPQPACFLKRKLFSYQFRVDNTENARLDLRKYQQLGFAAGRRTRCSGNQQ